jgi:hypothetical protein
MEIRFTRYLYEFNQVIYSLYSSLLEKKKEESLFWAYELYHSGFKYDAWCLVRDFYVENYAGYNSKITKRFDNIYLEWKETGNDLLLGTVVSTLAIMPERTAEPKKIFIILYTNDRHSTQPINGLARNYLKSVSQYPIRRETEEVDSLVQDAYLGPNWLDYCTETPIWQERIQSGNGCILENRVVFEKDDDLDAFYELWGFEPDEQPMTIHQFHGVFSIMHNIHLCF